MPRQTGGSSDYVRTFRDVVGAIQIKVANALKAGLSMVVKEADILDRAARHLRERKGWDEGRIAQELKEWGKCLSDFASYLPLRSVEIVDDKPAFSENVVDRAAGISAVSLKQSTVTKRGRVPRGKKFVITYSKGRKTSRLHSTEKNCFWAIASVKDSEAFDYVSEDMYDYRCKFCWPELCKKAVDSEVDEVVDTGTDSSSEESE